MIVGGGQYLVARLQVEATGDDRQALLRSAGEDEVLARGAEKRADRAEVRADGVEGQRRVLVALEVGALPLPAAVLLRHDRAQRRAEACGIEPCEPRIEHQLCAHPLPELARYVGDVARGKSGRTCHRRRE